MFWSYCNFVTSARTIWCIAALYTSKSRGTRPTHGRQVAAGHFTAVEQLGQTGVAERAMQGGKRPWQCGTRSRDREQGSRIFSGSAMFGLQYVTLCLQMELWHFAVR